MEDNKIVFRANKAWLDKESNSAPKPISRTIPDWYRKADRFAKKPDGEYYQDPMTNGKIPTWKACPAIFDIMATGYCFRTPCDFTFTLKENGEYKVTPKSSKYASFIEPRGVLPQFTVPHGYKETHFAWFADWQVIVPEGYSCIYIHPANRFELPFITTSGIIDNDNLHNPGSLPFFLKEGWEGVIEAGTPIIQIIPFKRDNWDSEHEEQNNAIDIVKNQMEITSFYRTTPDGGVYKNKVWTPRRYS